MAEGAMGTAVVMGSAMKRLVVWLGVAVALMAVVVAVAWARAMVVVAELATLLGLTLSRI